MTPSPLSDEVLELARDLGAATYLSACIHLMARHLGVDDSDDEAINAMATQMIESVNLGTEATWCALMSDREGMHRALERFCATVEAL